MISLLNGSSVNNVPSQLLQLPSAIWALKTEHYPKKTQHCWLLAPIFSTFHHCWKTPWIFFQLISCQTTLAWGQPQFLCGTATSRQAEHTQRCCVCSIWGHWSKSKKSSSSLHQKCSILNKSRSTERLVIPNKLLCCTSKYNSSPSFSLCMVLCCPS